MCWSADIDCGLFRGFPGRKQSSESAQARQVIPVRYRAQGRSGRTGTDRQQLTEDTRDEDTQGSCAQFYLCLFTCVCVSVCACKCGGTVRGSGGFTKTPQSHLPRPLPLHRHRSRRFWWIRTQAHPTHLACMFTLHFAFWDTIFTIDFFVHKDKMQYQEKFKI